MFRVVLTLFIPHIITKISLAKKNLKIVAAADKETLTLLCLFIYLEGYFQGCFEALIVVLNNIKRVPKS